MSERIEADGTPWERKVRSGVLLAVLVGVLGAAAAVILGVLAVVLTSFVDQALG